MRWSWISSIDISAPCSCYVMTVVMTTDIRVESNRWTNESHEFGGTPMLLPICASEVEKPPIFLFSAANWSLNEFCSCLLPRFPRLNTKQVHLLCPIMQEWRSSLQVVWVRLLLLHQVNIHHLILIRINLPVWKLILLHLVKSSSNLSALFPVLSSFQYVFSESILFQEFFCNTNPEILLAFYTATWSTTSV